MLGLCCRTRAFSGRSEEGMLSVWHAGVSFLWPLWLGNVGARCMGFRSLITWAQPLWWAGLVAPRHVESSRIRDQTRDKLVSPGRFLYTGQPGKLKKKKKKDLFYRFKLEEKLTTSLKAEADLPQSASRPESWAFQWAFHWVHFILLDCKMSICKTPGQSPTSAHRV